MMMIYGGIAYAIFLVAFLYSVAFVGDVFVPVTVDGPLRAPPMTAVLIDAALLGAFAVQHSVMARPAFKRWWTRFVPPAIERSTYVLTTSVLLLAIFTAWQPIVMPVWDLRGTPAGAFLAGLCGFGWLVVLAATFMISHFELFGLTQVWYAAHQRIVPKGEFQQKLFYRFVRHPLMTGFLIAFWSGPIMTRGHLLFAALSTGYIIVGTLLEERDLLAAFGSTYERYRQAVPMLIPFMKRRAAPSAQSLASQIEGVDR